MEEGTYEIPNDMNNVEDSYEIPMEMNNVEGTYDIPGNMHNVEGSYDILMNNGEAKVQVGTKKTGFMKNKTVIMIVLILIIIFVVVCISMFFAGKASADVKVLPNIQTTVSKVSPDNTQAINTTIPSPKSTSNTGPTSESTICLEGWVKHGGSCYFFGEDSYDTFPNAVFFCQSLNAKLIEVDSDSENQFVKDYLSNLESSKPYYWMGLTDSTTEGTFLLYSSNKNASFFDWDDQEPNNAGTGEDCVVLKKGSRYRWMDLRCIRPSEFNYCAAICKL